MQEKVSCMGFSMRLEISVPRDNWFGGNSAEPRYPPNTVIPRDGNFDLHLKPMKDTYIAPVTIIIPTEKANYYDENRLSAIHRIFLHDLLPLIRDVVNDRSRVCLATNAWIWRYDVKSTKAHVHTVKGR